MKGIIQILNNKITRNAILFSVFILFVYRLGANIVTPGVNNSAMTGSIISLEVSTLFDFFGGGSLSQMGLFALGVSPYITASIIIQLLESDLIPTMSEWKHQGVEGQEKRSRWTKNLTIILAFVQATGILVGAYISTKSPIVANPTFLGYMQVALLLTVGSAVVVWLADRITENGIGNGISVIICAGILARIPAEIKGIQSEFSVFFSQSPLPSITSDFSGWFNAIKQMLITNVEFRQTVILWAIIFVGTLLLIIGIIYYTLAERRIPINYVRANNTQLKQNSYLPIKLNPAGVIPVIFVQPFLLILGIALSYAFNYIPFFANNGHGQIEGFLLALTGNIATGSPYANIYSVAYIINYGILILLFSMFYSYVQMNPEEMAKSLQRQAAYIANVRPGSDTLSYLTKTIRRTSMWGGLILVIIAIIPLLIEKFTNVNVSLSLIGTGLIIIVSVIVQIYQSLLNKSETKKYRIIIGD